MAHENTLTTNQRSRSRARHDSHVEHQPLQPLPLEERHRRIAEAAYFIAERRGFRGGSALEDWLAAEIQIDAVSAVMDPKGYTSRRAAH